MLEKAWASDPKRMAFTFARYKFVAKMFSGMGQVLEIGANSGFMGRIVRQHVSDLTLSDRNEVKGVVGIDYTEGHFCKEFDGVYALDVLEHVSPVDEDAFMRNVCKSLAPHGSCIIGMPSIESQPHASEESKREHVNCKSEPALRALMQRYFHCVYLFGMNDETLHTGFGPMCQYRLAVCNSKRVLH